MAPDLYQCEAELSCRTSTPVVYYVTIIEIIWTPCVIIIIFTSINSNNVKKIIIFSRSIYSKKYGKKKTY